jgi:hypothetical protein
MSVHVFILGVLAIIHIVLAIWTFRTYERSEAIRYFCGFLLGMSLIAALNGAMLIPGTESSWLTITRVGYVAGVFTFTMFSLFALAYLGPMARPKIGRAFIWALPLAFFAPYVFLNNEFVRSVDKVDGLPKETIGTQYWPFLVVVFCLVLWSVLLLVKKLRMSVGEMRKNTAMLLTAFILSAGVGGLALDVILPAFDIRYAHYIGIETSVLLAGLTAFIVGKR